MLEIFDFFSKKISQILKEELVDKPMEEINTLEEIRIRSNGNITLKFSDKQEILSKKITYKDILETLQIMCDNSIYSYQNEIKNRKPNFWWPICQISTIFSKYSLSQVLLRRLRLTILPWFFIIYVKFKQKCRLGCITIY